MATIFIRHALLACMTFLFALTLAHPTGRRDVSVTAPSKDPFYDPPAGFESTDPGTILRNRSISAAFDGSLPDPIEAHQLLYRTTAVDGSAIATVTTIFKPWIPKKDRFISFQTPYDSSATKCDPSYGYQLGANSSGLVGTAEFLIIQVHLMMGNIVSSPDYEGPDAAFSPGHLEGMGTLDSIRAVNNFRETLGLSENPMVVGVGYSGGAIATGWAASLQSSYAPELNVKGWAHGGTPVNLTSTLLHLDGTSNSGYAPAALDGLNKPSAYGAELGPAIDRIIKPEGKAVLEYANTHCSDDDLSHFQGKSIFSPEFQTEGRGVLSDPTISSVLAKNVMGVTKDMTPIAPVFVYHAEQDEIIPYDSVVKLVGRWCNYGAKVKFTTFGTGGHVTTAVVGVPDVVHFVEDAFSGNPPTECTENSELDSLLNPLALGIELEPILAKLKDLQLKAENQ